MRSIIAPMTDRTLYVLAFFGMIGLAACTTAIETAATAPAAVDPGGWRYASGKVPSKAEFAAISATCESKGGTTDSCLTELGLKRAP